MTIGRYQITREIARSNDIVYEAFDPQLGRKLALKELSLDVRVQEPERRLRIDRFFREARAAGNLSHPGIVTIFDFGEDNGRYFIAMEYLEGETLKSRISRNGPLPTEEAVRILSALCDAVEYAHARQIVHRDIKPANIFMTGRTQPRVLDFGIARIRQAESLAQRDDPQSRFHELVGGSPYYMSPEQVRRLTVDRRVDVYALGVVLYELLTGQRPFSGNSLEEIAEAVLRQPVPLAHEVNPEVPRALSEIVAQAMHRERDQRIRSARRLSQALRDWIERTDEPDAPAERRGAVRDEGPGGVKRWLMPLAALGWVLALAGIGWAIWR
mgnify:CR=1 FL=1